MRNTFKNKIISIIISVIAVIAFVFSFIFLNDDSGSGDNGVKVGDVSVGDVVPNEYLTFRNEEYLNEHYEKHGIEMGFKSPEEYLDAANAVVDNQASLYKLEAEDGDGVYYLEATNEFVIVSKDGYIRTYFYPSDGIDYFNRQ